MCQSDVGNSRAGELAEVDDREVWREFRVDEGGLQGDD